MLAGASAQHRGPREQQHDHVFTEPGLHVVADGNGVMGDVSERVVSLFRAHLREARALDVPLEAAIEKAHVWPEDDETVEIDGTIYKHGLAMARVLGHPLLAKHGVTAEPDLRAFELPPGETLLLCSDGLRPWLEHGDGVSRLCELLATRSLADTRRS